MPRLILNERMCRLHKDPRVTTVAQRRQRNARDYPWPSGQLSSPPRLTHRVRPRPLAARILAWLGCARVRRVPAFTRGIVTLQTAKDLAARARFRRAPDADRDRSVRRRA